MIINCIIFLCIKDTSLKTEPCMIETESSKKKYFILYWHQNTLTRNVIINDSSMQDCNCWLKLRWMAVANVKFSASFHLNSKFKFNKHVLCLELLHMEHIKQGPCPKEADSLVESFSHSRFSTYNPFYLNNRSEH